MLRGLVLPVLEYCSEVWCSVADIHRKLLHGPCSQWCQVFNWGVFECDLAHHRSVAVLCIPLSILIVLYLCRICRCGLHAAL